MTSTNRQSVYEMFWNTQHIASNEKFDAKLVKFNGWENVAGMISTRGLQLPKEVVFEADFEVTRHSDYPFNDVNWPLMSRRMLDVLLSVRNFPHRAIPVRFLDASIPVSKRVDSDRKLRPCVVNDHFVAVQLAEHLDVFDWQKSEYKPNRLRSDRVATISKLALKEMMGGYPPLFRMAAKPSYLFVSAQAKQQLEQEGVQGAIYWTIDHIKV